MKTILVCDDDEMIVEVTKIILKKKGYNVFTLLNTNQLLEKVTAIKPDLILMDLMIPTSGGEAAIKLLRSDETTKEIPVIVFSANMEIETIANQINADGFIMKPFEMKEFENTIENYMALVP